MRAVAPPPARERPRLPGRYAEWRFPAEASSIPVLRRRLRTLLVDGGVDDDQAYDLLLAACEAATNAFEHAQDPTEPFFDVTVHVDDDQVRISVRDYGQWRERMASMDRGRGGNADERLRRDHRDAQSRGHDGADRQPPDGRPLRRDRA